MTREAYSYRADPAVPAFADDRPIIVFDGECVLCSRFAQFVMRHDREKRFRLLAAQSTTGSALYTHLGLAAPDYETNILLEDGRAWLKSEAGIRIISRLGFPWVLIVLARLFPLALRDRAYGVIARNRIRWFGARDVCYRPTADEADRFI